MARDPGWAAETREWLEFALHDLFAAAADLGSEHPLHEDVTFHAQQAAEKAMKAVLYWHDVPFRKTHDMERLVKQCLDAEPALADVLDAVKDMTVFAEAGRYPHGFADAPPTREDAQDALRRARAVYDAVCALLPPEARPIEAPPSV